MNTTNNTGENVDVLVKGEKKIERGQKEREHRKKVLLEFAKATNIDPLIEDHWYNTSRQKLLQYPVYLLTLSLSCTSSFYELFQYREGGTLFYITITV